MMEPDVSPRALIALASLSCAELALSAYLPTDPGAGHHYYRALLHDLSRAALRDLDSGQLVALDREVPAVLAALDKHRFDSPSVAVFSCQPRALLRIWRLAEPVPGQLTVAGRLDLAPIREQLVQLPPTLAAVVDKQQARLYGLVLDELTEVGHVDGMAIRRHRQGGWSATGLQRQQDEHARCNLVEAAAAIGALLVRDGYQRLVIAGPSEARAELRALLRPEALNLLAVEGSIPMYASGNELARRLRGLERALAAP